MTGARSSRAGSTVIEVIVLTGMIAVMIALLIPVVLNSGDDSATPKFAQKTNQKHPAARQGSITIRTVKL